MSQGTRRKWVGFVPCASGRVGGGLLLGMGVVVCHNLCTMGVAAHPCGRVVYLILWAAAARVLKGCDTTSLLTLNYNFRPGTVC